MHWFICNFASELINISVMAINKSSMLYSVVKFKCPQCHEGNFFVSNPYNLKKTGKLHDHCSECGLKFAKEPGFYYGAMYVSYGFGVAVFIAVVVLYYLIFRRVDAWNMLIIIAAISVLTAPLSLALSKIIWANIFIRYKGKETV
jgi:uncharacterized protein (DUF983 family)